MEKETELVDVSSPERPSTPVWSKLKKYNLLPSTPGEEPPETPPEFELEMTSPHRLTLSGMDINVEEINKSLNAVNTFASKRFEKYQPILLLYEITAEGESAYKSMTLKELLTYINDYAHAIDETLFERKTNEELEVLSEVSSPATQSIFAHSQFHENFHSVNENQIESNKSAPANLEIQLEKVRTNRRRGSLLPNRNSVTRPIKIDTLSTLAPIKSNSTTSSVPNLSHPQNENILSKDKILQARRRSRIIQKAMNSLHGEEHQHHQPLSDEDAVKLLRFRDLRKIEIESNILNESNIIVRRHAIIFIMDPIHAVVMSDRLLFIVPDGADSLLGILDQYMKEWVENKQRAQLIQPSSPNVSLNRSGRKRRQNINLSEFEDIPFETHVFDALLTTVKSVESQHLNRISTRMQILLSHYKKATFIPLEVQSELRLLKNDLSQIVNRVSRALDALRLITEDDQDMALMNLTLLKQKPNLYRLPLEKEIWKKHDEIEELLESYVTDLQSVLTQATNLRVQIQNAEDMTYVRLDILENRLLFANTLITLLTCAKGFAGFQSGAYGMNLDQAYYLHSTKTNSFALVFATSALSIILFYFLGWTYMTSTGMFPREYIPFSFSFIGFREFLYRLLSFCGFCMQEIFNRIRYLINSFPR